MTESIYILQLSCGYYYIGKSVDPQKSFEEHVSGKCGAWTELHKPLRIRKTVQHDNVDSFVKQYMKKYGIQRVRGGSYPNLLLYPSEVLALQKELWGNTEYNCSVCGRRGHTEEDCYATRDIYGRKIPLDESESDEEDEDCIVCSTCSKTYNSQKAFRRHIC